MKLESLIAAAQQLLRENAPIGQANREWLQRRLMPWTGLRATRCASASCCRAALHLCWTSLSFEEDRMLADNIIAATGGSNGHLRPIPKGLVWV
jgi:hypothetical protein